MKLKINPIKIGHKWIGEKKPCYVIAEIGSNFNDDINLAKKLIKKAKDVGADAAKFQSFQVDKILSKRGFEKKVSFQAKWKKPVWQVYKEAEFPLEWISKLSAFAKKCKIDFLSTPYHIEAVDELIRCKVPAIKVGSGEITNLEFLEYIAKTGKPILLATGASTQKEVDVAVKIISRLNKKLILMQATTQYPSPIEDANLRVVDTFKNKYKINVGYSDHTPGFTSVMGSIALGACTIEKHFTLDKSSSGPDHPHSLDPIEFTEMVKRIREMEIVLGSHKKKIEKSETQTSVIQKRGIWTINEIKKGEKFTRLNIDVLRPNLGIPASQFRKILKRKSKRNYSAFSPLKWQDF
tara:strand:- start:644 stop:1696 length:1053 start_codon:yes stop_codon:yes gene_type:complete